MGAKAVWIQLTSAIYHLPRPYMWPSQAAINDSTIQALRHWTYSIFLEYFRKPMEHRVRFTQPLARRPRLCGSAIFSDYHIVGCTQGAGCWYHVFCQGVSWGVWESHAPPTPWAGVEPQLKGCVSTSRGGNPLATPLPKRGRVRSLCQRPQ